MKDGIEKIYRDNGKLWCEIPCHQGKRHGAAKWYHDNGKLWLETPFCQGKQHGVCKDYYSDGKLDCKYYYLYGEEVTKEEYRKHELMNTLAGL